MRSAMRGQLLLWKILQTTFWWNRRTFGDTPLLDAHGVIVRWARSRVEAGIKRREDYLRKMWKLASPEQREQLLGLDPRVRELND